MLPIGKVLKSNGTQGEVLIGFRDVAAEDILIEEPVYIVFDGLPVPFFIEALTPRGSGRTLMRLSGVDDLRDAEELVGRELLADYFEEEEPEDGPEAFIGWSIEGLGEITGWMDIPGNPCLEVRVEEPAAGTSRAGAGARTILVPFHEDLILKADGRHRILVMNLPEGLA